jgi:hypothetical protein
LRDRTTGGTGVERDTRPGVSTARREPRGDRDTEDA